MSCFVRPFLFGAYSKRQFCVSGHCMSSSKKYFPPIAQIFDGCVFTPRPQRAMSMSCTPSLPMSPVPKSCHQRQMLCSMFGRKGTFGAGPSHVSKSRCAGGVPGLLLPILLRRWLFQALATSISPMAPSANNSIASRMPSELRVWVPTWITRLFRRAASIISRPSRRLWLAGFST